MAEPDPLVELLDEGHASDRRASRARERALRRMAEEGAELAGTLVDLAERQSPVALVTMAGRRHHGVVVGVEGDYVVVRAEGGAEVHVRLDALTTVRPHPGERHQVAAGARRRRGDRRLIEVLGRLADERQRVSLVTVTGEVVAGELRAVGADVVTVRVDAAGAETCYVAAGAVSEVAAEM